MKWIKILAISLTGGLLLSGLPTPDVVHAKVTPYVEVYYHAQLAQLLNITEEALKAAEKTGKNLIEIALEQGISRETIASKWGDLKQEKPESIVEKPIEQQQTVKKEENTGKKDSSMTENKINTNPEQQMPVQEQESRNPEQRQPGQGQGDRNPELRQPGQGQGNPDGQTPKNGSEKGNQQNSDN